MPRFEDAGTVTPLMTPFKTRFVPPLEMANLLVMQTILVDEVDYTTQSVF
jgi:hypothetical protein